MEKLKKTSTPNRRWVGGMMIGRFLSPPSLGANPTADDAKNVVYSASRYTVWRGWLVHSKTLFPRSFLSYIENGSIIEI